MPRITGRGILNTAMVGITYFIMSCCGNDDHRKPVTSYQCSNGIDDDGDGLTDYPADPGCSSATDDDESKDPSGCPTAKSGCKESTSKCAICINDDATEYCDFMDNNCNGQVDEGGVCTCGNELYSKFT